MLAKPEAEKCSQNCPSVADVMLKVIVECREMGRCCGIFRYCALVVEELICDNDAKEFVIAE